jgi:hypothetical protein
LPRYGLLRIRVRSVVTEEKLTRVVVCDNSHSDVTRYATLHSSHLKPLKPASTDYAPRSRGNSTVATVVCLVPACDYHRPIAAGKPSAVTRNLAAELKISRMPVLGFLSNCLPKDTWRLSLQLARVGLDPSRMTRWAPGRKSAERASRNGREARSTPNVTPWGGVDACASANLVG